MFEEENDNQSLDMDDVRQKLAAKYHATELGSVQSSYKNDTPEFIGFNNQQVKLTGSQLSSGVDATVVVLGLDTSGETKAATPSVFYNQTAVSLGRRIEFNTTESVDNTVEKYPKLISSSITPGGKLSLDFDATVITNVNAIISPVLISQNVMELSDINRVEQTADTPEIEAFDLNLMEYHYDDEPFLVGIDTQTPDQDGSEFITFELRGLSKQTRIELLDDTNQSVAFTAKWSADNEIWVITPSEQSARFKGQFKISNQTPTRLEINTISHEISSGLTNISNTSIVDLDNNPAPPAPVIGNYDDIRIIEKNEADFATTDDGMRLTTVVDMASVDFPADAYAYEFTVEVRGLNDKVTLLFNDSPIEGPLTIKGTAQELQAQLENFTFTYPKDYAWDGRAAIFIESKFEQGGLLSQLLQQQQFGIKTTVEPASIALLEIDTPIYDGSIAINLVDSHSLQIDLGTGENFEEDGSEQRSLTITLPVGVNLFIQDTAIESTNAAGENVFEISPEMLLDFNIKSIDGRFILDDVRVSPLPEDDFSFKSEITQWVTNNPESTSTATSTITLSGAMPADSPVIVDGGASEAENTTSVESLTPVELGVADGPINNKEFSIILTPDDSVKTFSDSATVLRLPKGLTINAGSFDLIRDTFQLDNGDTLYYLNIDNETNVIIDNTSNGVFEIASYSVAKNQSLNDFSQLASDESTINITIDTTPEIIPGKPTSLRLNENSFDKIEGDTVTLTNLSAGFSLYRLDAEGNMLGVVSPNQNGDYLINKSQLSQLATIADNGVTIDDLGYTVGGVTFGNSNPSSEPPAQSATLSPEDSINYFNITINPEVLTGEDRPIGRTGLQKDNEIALGLELSDIVLPEGYVIRGTVIAPVGAKFYFETASTKDWSFTVNDSPEKTIYNAYHLESLRLINDNGELTILPSDIELKIWAEPFDARSMYGSTDINDPSTGGNSRPTSEAFPNNNRVPDDVTTTRVDLDQDTQGVPQNPTINGKEITASNYDLNAEVEVDYAFDLSGYLNEQQHGLLTSVSVNDEILLTVAPSLSHALIFNNGSQVYTLNPLWPGAYSISQSELKYLTLIPALNETFDDNPSLSLQVKNGDSISVDVDIELRASEKRVAELGSVAVTDSEPTLIEQSLPVTVKNFEPQLNADGTFDLTGLSVTGGSERKEVNLSLSYYESGVLQTKTVTATSVAAIATALNTAYASLPDTVKTSVINDNLPLIIEAEFISQADANIETASTKVVSNTVFQGAIEEVASYQLSFDGTTDLSFSGDNEAEFSLIAQQELISADDTVTPPKYFNILVAKGVTLTGSSLGTGEHYTTAEGELYVIKNTSGTFALSDITLTNTDPNLALGADKIKVTAGERYLTDTSAPTATNNIASSPGSSTTVFFENTVTLTINSVFSVSRLQLLFSGDYRDILAINAVNKDESLSDIYSVSGINGSIYLQWDGSDTSPKSVTLKYLTKNSEMTLETMFKGGYIGAEKPSVEMTHASKEIAPPSFNETVTINEASTGAENTISFNLDLPKFSLPELTEDSSVPASYSYSFPDNKTPPTRYTTNSTVYVELFIPKGFMLSSPASVGQSNQHGTFYQIEKLMSAYSSGGTLAITLNSIDNAVLAKELVIRTLISNNSSVDMTFNDEGLPTGGEPVTFANPNYIADTIDGDITITGNYTPPDIFTSLADSNEITSFGDFALHENENLQQVVDNFKNYDNENLVITIAKVDGVTLFYKNDDVEPPQYIEVLNSNDSNAWVLSLDQLNTLSARTKNDTDAKLTIEVAYLGTTQTIDFDLDKQVASDYTPPPVENAPVLSIDLANTAITIEEDSTYALSALDLKVTLDGEESAEAATSGLILKGLSAHGNDIALFKDDVLRLPDSDGNYHFSSIEDFNTTTLRVKQHVSFDNIPLTVEAINNQLGVTATSSSIAMKVSAVADAAILDVALVTPVTEVLDGATVLLDSDTVEFDIDALLVDRDASEALTITISGLDAKSVDATKALLGDSWTYADGVFSKSLSAGEDFDSAVTLTGLTKGQIHNLTITATTKETLSDESVSVDKSINVLLKPDLSIDAPTLIAESHDWQADQPLESIYQRDSATSFEEIAQQKLYTLLAGGLPESELTAAQEAGFSEYISINFTKGSLPDDFSLILPFTDESDGTSKYTQLASFSSDQDSISFRIHQSDLFNLSIATNSEQALTQIDFSTRFMFDVTNLNGEVIDFLYSKASTDTVNISDDTVIVPPEITPIAERSNDVIQLEDQFLEEDSSIVFLGNKFLFREPDDGETIVINSFELNLPADEGLSGARFIYDLNGVDTDVAFPLSGTPAELNQILATLRLQLPKDYATDSDGFSLTPIINSTINDFTITTSKDVHVAITPIADEPTLTAHLLRPFNDYQPGDDYEVAIDAASTDSDGSESLVLSFHADELANKAQLSFEVVDANGAQTDITFSLNDAGYWVSSNLGTHFNGKVIISGLGADVAAYFGLSAIESVGGNVATVNGDTFTPQYTQINPEVTIDEDAGDYLLTDLVPYLNAAVDTGLHFDDITFSLPSALPAGSYFTNAAGANLGKDIRFSGDFATVKAAWDEISVVFPEHYANSDGVAIDINTTTSIAGVTSDNAYLSEVKITPITETDISLNAALLSPFAEQSESFLEIAINASTADTDGSERLSLELTGIEATAKIADIDGKSWSYADGIWTIADLAPTLASKISISSLSPGVKDLTVTAISQDEGAAAVRSPDIALNANITNTPLVIEAVEDSVVDLSVLFNLINNDDLTIDSLTLSLPPRAPKDAYFSYPDGDDTLNANPLILTDLTVIQLSEVLTNLTLTFPDDYAFAAGMALSVDIQSSILGQTSLYKENIELTITPEVEDFSVSGLSEFSGGIAAISLDLGAVNDIDSDGSETTTISFSAPSAITVTIQGYVLEGETFGGQTRYVIPPEQFNAFELTEIDGQLMLEGIQLAGFTPGVTDITETVAFAVTRSEAASDISETKTASVDIEIPAPEPAPSPKPEPTPDPEPTTTLTGVEDGPPVHLQLSPDAFDEVVGIDDSALYLSGFPAGARLYLVDNGVVNGFIRPDAAGFFKVEKSQLPQIALGLGKNQTASNLDYQVSKLSDPSSLTTIDANITITPVGDAVIIKDFYLSALSSVDDGTLNIPLSLKASVDDASETISTLSLKLNAHSLTIDIEQDASKAGQLVSASGKYTLYVENNKHIDFANLNGASNDTLNEYFNSKLSASEKTALLNQDQSLSINVTVTSEAGESASSSAANVIEVDHAPIRIESTNYAQPTFTTDSSYSGFLSIDTNATVKINSSLASEFVSEEFDAYIAPEYYSIVLAKGIKPADYAADNDNYTKIEGVARDVYRFENTAYTDFKTAVLNYTPSLESLVKSETANNYFKNFNDNDMTDSEYLAIYTKYSGSTNSPYVIPLTILNKESILYSAVETKDNRLTDTEKDELRPIKAEITTLIDEYANDVVGTPPTDIYQKIAYLLKYDGSNRISTLKPDYPDISLTLTAENDHSFTNLSHDVEVYAGNKDAVLGYFDDSIGEEIDLGGNIANHPDSVTDIELIDTLTIGAELLNQDAVTESTDDNLFTLLTGQSNVTIDATIDASVAPFITLSYLVDGESVIITPNASGHWEMTTTQLQSLSVSKEAGYVFAGEPELSILIKQGDDKITQLTYQLHTPGADDFATIDAPNILVGDPLVDNVSEPVISDFSLNDISVTDGKLTTDFAFNVDSGSDHQTINSITLRPNDYDEANGEFPALVINVVEDARLAGEIDSRSAPYTLYVADASSLSISDRVENAFNQWLAKQDSSELKAYIQDVIPQPGKFGNLLNPAETVFNLDIEVTSQDKYGNSATASASDVDYIGAASAPNVTLTDLPDELFVGQNSFTFGLDVDNTSTPPTHFSVYLPKGMEPFDRYTADSKYTVVSSAKGAVYTFANDAYSAGGSVDNFQNISIRIKDDYQYTALPLNIVAYAGSESLAYSALLQTTGADIPLAFNPQASGLPENFNGAFSINADGLVDVPDKLSDLINQFDEQALTVTLSTPDALDKSSVFVYVLQGDVYRPVPLIGNEWEIPASKINDIRVVYAADFDGEAALTFNVSYAKTTGEGFSIVNNASFALAAGEPISFEAPATVFGIEEAAPVHLGLNVDSIEHLDTELSDDDVKIELDFAGLPVGSALYLLGSAGVVTDIVGVISQTDSQVVVSKAQLAQLALSLPVDTNTSAYGGDKIGFNARIIEPAVNQTFIIAPFIEIKPLPEPAVIEELNLSLALNAVSLSLNMTLSVKVEDALHDELQQITLSAGGETLTLNLVQDISRVGSVEKLDGAAENELTLYVDNLARLVDMDLSNQPLIDTWLNSVADGAVRTAHTPLEMLVDIKTQSIDGDDTQITASPTRISPVVPYAEEGTTRTVVQTEQRETEVISFEFDADISQGLALALEAGFLPNDYYDLNGEVNQTKYLHTQFDSAANSTIFYLSPATLNNGDNTLTLVKNASAPLFADYLQLSDALTINQYTVYALTENELNNQTISTQTSYVSVDSNGSPVKTTAHFPKVELGRLTNIELLLDEATDITAIFSALTPLKQGGGSFTGLQKEALLSSIAESPTEDGQVRYVITINNTETLQVGGLDVAANFQINGISVTDNLGNNTTQGVTASELTTEVRLAKTIEEPAAIFDTRATISGDLALDGGLDFTLEITANDGSGSELPAYFSVLLPNGLTPSSPPPSNSINGAGKTLYIFENSEPATNRFALTIESDDSYKLSAQNSNIQTFAGGKYIGTNGFNTDDAGASTTLGIILPSINNAVDLLTIDADADSFTVADISSLISAFDESALTLSLTNSEHIHLFDKFNVPIPIAADGTLSILPSQLQGAYGMLDKRAGESVKTSLKVNYGDSPLLSDQMTLTPALSPQFIAPSSNTTLTGVENSAPINLGLSRDNLTDIDINLSDEEVSAQFTFTDLPEGTRIVLMEDGKVSDLLGISESDKDTSITVTRAQLAQLSVSFPDQVGDGIKLNYSVTPVVPSGSDVTTVESTIEFEANASTSTRYIGEAGFNNPAASLTVNVINGRDKLNPDLTLANDKWDEHTESITIKLGSFNTLGEFTQLPSGEGVASTELTFNVDMFDQAQSDYANGDVSGENGNYTLHINQAFNDGDLSAAAKNIFREWINQRSINGETLIEKVLTGDLLNLQIEVDSKADNIISTNVLNVSGAPLSIPDSLIPLSPTVTSRRVDEDVELDLTFIGESYDRFIKVVLPSGFELVSTGLDAPITSISAANGNLFSIPLGADITSLPSVRIVNSGGIIAEDIPISIFYTRYASGKDVLFNGFPDNISPETIPAPTKDHDLNTEVDMTQSSAFDLYQTDEMSILFENFADEFANSPDDLRIELNHLGTDTADIALFYGNATPIFPDSEGRFVLNATELKTLYAVTTGDVDDLRLSVSNGETKQFITFDLNKTTSTVSADSPQLTINFSSTHSRINMDEDGDYALSTLDLSASLTDNDTNFSLDIRLSELPAGFTLTRGTGEDKVTLSPDSLGNYHFASANEFNATTLTGAPNVSGNALSLVLSASATLASGEVISTTHNQNRAFDLVINPVADEPLLDVTIATPLFSRTKSGIDIIEGDTLILDIDSQLVDNDTSESLRFKITGVGEEVSISTPDGWSPVREANGDWLISPKSPAIAFNGQITLTGLTPSLRQAMNIIAIAKEAASGDTAMTPSPISIATAPDFSLLPLSLESNTFIEGRGSEVTFNGSDYFTYDLLAKDIVIPEGQGLSDHLLLSFDKATLPVGARFVTLSASGELVEAMIADSDSDSVNYRLTASELNSLALLLPEGVTTEQPSNPFDSLAFSVSYIADIVDENGNALDAFYSPVTTSELTVEPEPVTVSDIHLEDTKDGVSIDFSASSSDEEQGISTIGIWTPQGVEPADFQDNMVAGIDGEPATNSKYLTVNDGGESTGQTYYFAVNPTSNLTVNNFALIKTDEFDTTSDDFSIRIKVNSEAASELEPTPTTLNWDNFTPSHLPSMSDELPQAAFEGISDDWVSVASGDFDSLVEGGDWVARSDGFNEVDITIETGALITGADSANTNDNVELYPEENNDNMG